MTALHRDVPVVLYLEEALLLRRLRLIVWRRTGRQPLKLRREPHLGVPLTP